MHFKGTTSQEEQKTIFSGSKINKMALSRYSDAMEPFSTVRHIIRDTYIDFPQSVNSGMSISKTWRRKAILGSKGNSGLSYFSIDEILLSSHGDGKMQESQFD